MSTISIQVEPDLATAFQSIEPDEQKKIQEQMSDWLRRSMGLTKLQITMDKLSDEAEANGLTPEILQSILDE
jgi:hypothetical protein